MANMIPPADRGYLQGVFQSYDTNGSGSIGVTELQQALSNGTWKPFNVTTVRMMIGMFDRNHTGNVNFEEFVLLWGYITEWLNCFKRFDRDNSGNIDRNELYQALRSFGFFVNEPILNILMTKYDTDRKGSINFDDFIECCVRMRGMTEAFRYADTDHDSRITLTYEDFVKLVLNLCN